MFSNEHIWSMNLNTNFLLFCWKSRELLSIEFVPQGYPKYESQLCTDPGG